LVPAVHIRNLPNSVLVLLTVEVVAVEALVQVVGIVLVAAAG
jgi:hypothetical protein